MEPKRGRGKTAPRKAPLRGCKGGSTAASGGGEPVLTTIRQHFEWTERVVQYFFKEDVHCADARSMRTYLLKMRTIQPAMQIQMHMASISRLNLLPRSFYTSLPSGGRLSEWIVEVVGRFVFEGMTVMDDLKKHIDRWDSNLKEGAVAANRFAELAKLLSLEEVSSWALELEQACLHPTSPVAIYGTYEKIRCFYRRARIQLWLLFISAKSVIQLASAPMQDALVAQPPPAVAVDTPAAGAVDTPAAGAVDTPAAVAEGPVPSKF